MTPTTTQAPSPSASTAPQTADGIRASIRAITAAYRGRLRLRWFGTLLSATLCAASLAWRAQQLGMWRPWGWIAVAAAGLALAAWVCWSWPRQWTAAAQLPSSLDRRLHLEARLLTAAEFAEAPTLPALYAWLAQDAGWSPEAVKKQLPFPINRPTAVLLFIALLLLLWPGAGSLLNAPPFVKPPEPKHEDRQQQQNQPQQNQSQQPQSGGSQSPPSNQPSQSNGQPQPSGGQQPQNSQGQAGQSSPQSQPSGQTQPSSMKAGASDAQQQQSGAPQRQKDGAAAQQQQQAGATQQQQNQGGGQGHNRSGSGSGSQAQQAGRQGSQQQPGSSKEGAQQSEQQRAGDRAGGEGVPRAAERAAGGGQQRQQQGGTAAGSQQLSAASAAKAEALQGDIQQLLKQLSGEIQQLQAQPNQKSDQPNPLPGTSTDTELYGGAKPLDPARGSQLPIQLETDRAPTASHRKGTGVGQPSGRIAEDAPELKPEDVTLADQAAAGGEGAQRQAIPPEYRPVFERLQQQPTTTKPGESTP